MNAETIISCPRCLRQYSVDPEQNGKLAQCHACKATFFVSITTLATGESAFVLVHPIHPCINFMRASCVEFLSNICDLVRLSGRRVSVRDLIRLIKDAFACTSDFHSALWANCLLNQHLKEAFCNASETVVKDRVLDLMGYFVGFLPGRQSEVRDMLEGAVLGVLYSLRQMDGVVEDEDGWIEPFEHEALPPA